MAKVCNKKYIIAEIKYFAISEKFAKILREESCVMINLLIWEFERVFPMQKVESARNKFKGK